MPSEMFGAPIGYSQAGADIRADLTTGVNVLKGLGEVAMQPAELRLKTAQAATAERALAQQEALARLLQQAGPGGVRAAGGEAPSITSRLYNLSSLALDAGMPEKAMAIAKDASQIAQHEASAISSQARTTLTRLQTIGERAELTGQMFGNAKNPTEWARANQLYEFQTGEKSPYADVPFDPRLSKTIYDNSMKIKDRVATEMRAAELAETRRHHKLSEAQADTLNEIRRNRAETAKRREDRLEREGGRGVASPSEGEISQAMRLIRKQFGERALSDLDIGDAAYEIAADAKERRTKNRALSASEAIAQAFKDAREAGDFNPGGGFLRYTPIIGGLFRPSYTKRRGESAEDAIIARPGISYEKGKYYVSPSGQIGVFDGSNMVIER